MERIIRTQTVTVESGATASTGIETDGLPLVGIVTPAALTSTSASMYGSMDGTTYYPIYDNNGAQATAQLSTSRWVACYWPDLYVPYVRLELDTAEGGARSLTLVFAEV